jgi:fructokinase
MLGGVELGGTKVVCVVGTSPDDVLAACSIHTADPESTLAQAVRFFEQLAVEHGPVDAVGVATFGPVELRPGHPRYGHVTTTPKPGWSWVDVAGVFRSKLRIPVGIDTDVGGAALAEARWGAGRDCTSLVYLTVGTGIGAGVLVDGALVHGLVHPELGHIRVPRHPDDDFAGACPYHQDCLEGLASGLAVARRFGVAAEELQGADLLRACDLVAHYLGLAAQAIVYAVAPSRIIVGGGLSRLPGLLPLVRTRLIEELGGYPGLDEHRRPDFLVPPRLGDLAGPLGALLLAEGARARGPEAVRTHA